MMTRLRPTTRLTALCTAGAWGLLALAAPYPAAAQDADYLAQLKACRAIADEAERLACYDAKVGAIVSASDAGDVKVVSREEVRKTRRQLFGITMPDIAILRGDGKDEEETSGLFETTIASGRQTGPATWRFTTAEGAVWEINTPPAQDRSDCCRRQGGLQEGFARLLLHQDQRTDRGEGPARLLTLRLGPATSAA